MPDDGAAGSSAAAPPSLARGDIIWGKCRGFPWWPCEIRSVRELKKPEPADGKEHKVRVRFLSTKDNAEVGVNSCVRPFPDNVAELSVVKKGMFKSPGLRMKFEAAVQEAVQRQESGAAPEGPWSDDDAVDEEEVLEAMQEAKAHLDAWKTSGHDLIGKHVAVRSPFLALFTRAPPDALYLGSRAFPPAHARPFFFFHPPTACPCPPLLLPSRSLLCSATLGRPRSTAVRRPSSRSARPTSP